MHMEGVPTEMVKKKALKLFGYAETMELEITYGG